MSSRSVILLVLLAILAPGAARAQDQDCELMPGAREATRSFVNGQETVYISGPARLICPGDVILEADSAVGSPSLGEFELIGNVFFQDSVKTLTSAWARYVRLEARLLARDNVVLTDRNSRSVVEGSELEYLPAGELRDESEAVIHGRPHAIFYQKKDESQPVEGDSTAHPLEVDADLMRIYGETRFLALGNVVLTQGETRGYAHEGTFDQDGQTILLTGTARLEGEGYTLIGDRIEALLAGDELDEVTASRDAELQAEDLDLQAPELRIFFEAGEVHRLVAVRELAGQSDEAAEKPVQPVIISRDFQLSADSIDALAPAQQLEVVIAVGDAYGVRAPDSLDTGLPEAIARDWLAGDTITGYFAREEAPAAQDTVPSDSVGQEEPKARTVLQRLVAVGEEGRAWSLYRIREKGREAEPPSANYLVANRIVLVMRDGEVSDVEADGPIEGMHLQPEGALKKNAPSNEDAQGTIPVENPPGEPR